MSRARLVARFVGGVALGLLLVATAAGSVAYALGYRPVAVTTGSMGRAAPPGSLVIARPVAAEAVAVGDILVMRRPGSATVTHRVTALSRTAASLEATTRGDANTNADPATYPLAGDELVAARVLPGAGTVLLALASPIAAIAVVTLIVLTAFATLLRLVWRRPVAARLAASGGLLALGMGAIAVSSLALFTDSEAVATNTFTTGTIDIAASPTAATVTMALMAPGDRVTAPLEISNTGSLELRYSMTSTTDEDTLASEMILVVKTGVSRCDAAGFASDGTTEYRGPLGSTTPAQVLGDVARGAQAGDRTLAPLTHEVLCLDVSLRRNAPNAISGLATTATFGFEAEQTVNNP